MLDKLQSPLVLLKKLRGGFVHDSNAGQDITITLDEHTTVGKVNRLMGTIMKEWDVVILDSKVGSERRRRRTTRTGPVAGASIQVPYLKFKTREKPTDEELDQLHRIIDGELAPKTEYAIRHYW